MAVYLLFVITLCCLEFRQKKNYSFAFVPFIRGTRWRSWLRHCATSRKVVNSIPDAVIAFFH